MNSFLIDSLKLNIIFKYVNLSIAVLSVFMMIPIYLFFLSIEEYGIWLAISAIASIFVIFDPGLANLIIQKISASKGSKNFESLSYDISNSLIMSLFVVVFIIIIGLYLSELAIDFLKIEAINEITSLHLYKILIISTSFSLVCFAIIGIIQGLHHSIYAGVVNLTLSISRIIICIIFFMLDYGIYSLPFSWLVSSLLALLLSIFFLIIVMAKENIKLKFQYLHFKNFLNLFIYSFGTRLAKIFSLGIDRILISRFFGQEILAFFNVTSAVPKQSENIVTQPISSLRPTLAHINKESPSEIKEIILKILSLVLWVVGWMFLGIYIFNESFVTLWINSEFYINEINTILVTLLSLRVLATCFSAILFSLGYIKFNSIIELVFSIFFIPFCLVGIKLNGLYGLISGICILYLCTYLVFMPYYLFKKINFNLNDLSKITKELFIVFFSSALTIIVIKFIYSFAHFSILYFLIYVIAASVLFFTFLYIFSSFFRQAKSQMFLKWIFKK